MTSRVLHGEMMDDPTLDPAIHHRALQGLARLNRISGSAAVIFKAVRDLIPKERPLRILDIATGAGDVPVGLWQCAQRRGLPLHIEACDVSATALQHAGKSAADAGAPIKFFQLDALRDPLPEGFDVVMCSLFLHHLSDEQALELVRKMAAAATKRLVINDLRRSRAGLATVWLGARLVTRCHVVHVDGPLSIRAAFTAQELRKLADRAGLTGASVRTRFPCRLLLTWNK